MDEWNIKRSLKERSKSTVFFVKKGQNREDKQKIEAKAACYTEQIIKAKNNDTIIMNNKLNNPKAAPKIHLSIWNRFLYNKKILAIPAFISKW